MSLSDWYKRIFQHSISNNSGTAGIAVYDNKITLTDFNNDIYMSDFVNNAIEKTANEISKLDIKSIVEWTDGVKIVNDDITRVFKYRPNPWQTTSDFLNCIEWIRKKTGNAYIYPRYDWVILPNGNRIKRFLEFYILNPQNVQFEIDNQNGMIHVNISMQDGRYKMPYSELIHIKWRRGSNLYKGGNDNGEIEDKEVYGAVNALYKTVQGLPKSIEASLGINGVYTFNTIIEREQATKERDAFEKHISTSKSGMVLVDLSGQFQPVNINPAQIPESTLRFLKSVICEKYNVSLEILAGTATDEQHEAFYQAAIEDFIVQFEQAFTDYCYTQREKDVGHKVRAYYARLKKLSTEKITNIATLATNTGLLKIDEIRDMYGLPPLPNGEGNRRVQSLNFVNVDEIDTYQKWKAGVGNKENTKSEMVENE